MTEFRNNAFLVIMTFIILNHLLCAVYLSVIWIADIFTVKSKIWRSGSICFVAFDIKVLFTVFTQLLTILLSISRLKVVLHPMDTSFKGRNFVSKLIAYLFLIAFILSLFCTLITKHTSKMLPTNLCIHFLEPSKSISVIKSIIWLGSISQTLIFLVTLFLNI